MPTAYMLYNATVAQTDNLAKKLSEPIEFVWQTWYPLLICEALLRRVVKENS